MGRIINTTFVLTLIVFMSCFAQDNSSKPVAETKVSAPKTDLHTAVFMNNIKAIRLHIEAGSDLNVPEPTRSSSPLITAAALNKTKAAKMLIEAGANLNYKNADGSTALHTAALFGYSDIINLLISSGIKLDLQNNDGATALHTAAFFGRLDVVETLLKKGADKTLTNKNGNTAIETIEIPFENVKGIYEMVEEGLKSLGFDLDYDQLKNNRKKIAGMLR